MLKIAMSTENREANTFFQDNTVEIRNGVKRHFGVFFGSFFAFFGIFLSFFFN